MEVFYINYFDDFPKLDKNSCTIGAFDGVHLGHISLINKTKELGLKTLVITFENLIKKNYQLITKEQKIKLIEELGVDYLIIFSFQAVQKVFFNEFIKMLTQINVKNIVCGDDFRFGYKREGDIVDLKKHFKVHIADYTMYNDTRVSTSIIKELICDGHVEYASQLLARDYKIIGEVIHGSKVGRKLGYPTANINYSIYLLPKNGVYVGKVKYKEKEYIGMINIGHNPTINEQKERRLEVHILDFSEEIYGEELEISFIKFIRDEERFSSKDELINRLESDYAICKNYLDMVK